MTRCLSIVAQLESAAAILPTAAAAASATATTAGCHANDNDNRQCIAEIRTAAAANAAAALATTATPTTSAAAIIDSNSPTTTSPATAASATEFRGRTKQHAAHNAAHSATELLWACNCHDLLSVCPLGARQPRPRPLPAGRESDSGSQSESEWAGACNREWRSGQVSHVTFATGFRQAPGTGLGAPGLFRARAGIVDPRGHHTATAAGLSNRQFAR